MSHRPPAALSRTRRALGVAAVAVSIATTTDLTVIGPPAAVAAPGIGCSALAAHTLERPDVVSATAQIVPAEAAIPAFCRVTLVQRPAITIRVALPLNTADQGKGAPPTHTWNGSIINQGGGGYAGSIADPTIALTRGAVGSITDTGHSAQWCNALNPRTNKPNSQPGCGLAGGGFVLNADNKLLTWQVKDFITDSPHAQTLWALDLTKKYYGKPAARNYWYGLSTGGRQGWEMAQKYGDLFDGFVVGLPAMNWNRFIIAGAWPAVVVNDLLGPTGLPPVKSAAATAAAVTACDSDDGVLDKTIAEPRRCDFDARTLQCTPRNSPKTCLTATQARVVNMIWDGPRDRRGRRLWGGVPRGAPIDTLLPQGNSMGPLMLTYVANWLNENPSYQWQNRLTIKTFEAAFHASFDKFRTTAATDSTDLHKVIRSKAKIIFFHGQNDSLINPFGSHNYIQRIYDRYGVQRTQTFLRTFFLPGLDHAPPTLAGGDAASQLLNTLEAWVNRGTAPDSLTQSYGDGRTRKVCAYPNEARVTGATRTGQPLFGCKRNVNVPPDLIARSRTAFDSEPH